jgi:hypothetical protein
MRILFTILFFVIVYACSAQDTVVIFNKQPVTDTVIVFDNDPGVDTAHLKYDTLPIAKLDCKKCMYHVPGGGNYSGKEIMRGLKAGKGVLFTGATLMVGSLGLFGTSLGLFIKGNYGGTLAIAGAACLGVGLPFSIAGGVTYHKWSDVKQNIRLMAGFTTSGVGMKVTF